MWGHPNLGREVTGLPLSMWMHLLNTELKHVIHKSENRLKIKRCHSIMFYGNLIHFLWF